MFGTLVESGSHAKDVRRTGSFFLLTLASYTLLIALAGIGSIYAYDAKLTRENMDALQLIDEPLVTFIKPEDFLPKSSTPTPSKTNTTIVTVRPDAVANINSTTLPTIVSTKPNLVASLPLGIYEISDTNRPASGGTGNTISIPNPNGNPLGNAASTSVKTIPPPPTILKTVEPKLKNPLPVSKGVINGLATFKPEPVYPAPARQIRVSGIVNVRILVDEAGKVISAEVMSGHPLLRASALAAARRARFTPTLLSNVPVKVQGVMTYNFKLE